MSTQRLFPLACGALAVMGAAAGAAPPVLYKAARPVVPTSQRFVTPTRAEPAYLNPPGFRWRTVSGADGYEMQVAQSKDFAGQSPRTYKNLRWNLFTPDAPFAPGRWYWRIRTIGQDGKASQWSDPLEFDIVPGLPSIPVPPFDELAARVRKAAHPRVFVSASNLASTRARVRVANQPAWERFVQGFEAAAKRLDTSDPKPVPGPRSVAANNRIFQDTMSRSEDIGQAVQGLALAHLLAGNPEHCAEGKRLLLLLANWDPNGPTHRRRHDPAFRSIMRALTRGYDWLRGSGCLAEPDRAAVERAVAARTPQYLEWFKTSEVNNRWPYASHVAGGMVYFGETAAVFAGVLPAAEEWLRFYVSMLPANYPSFGRSDGSWSEGGRYWIGSIDRHIFPIWGLSDALGIPLNQHPYFANTGYFKIYSNPPWSRMMPFGDLHNQSTGTGDGNVVETFGILLRNPDFTWYGAQARRLNGAGERRLDAQDMLTLDEATLKGLAGKAKIGELPLGRVFPETGLAVLRTNLESGAGDVQFMLKSNPYGAVSHAHSDQGNIYLAVDGHPLLIPSGHYQGGHEALYASPHHAGWTWQSWAHNVPLVDGKGQARSENAAGQIEHFFSSALASYVRADATRSYAAENGEEARRVLPGFAPELLKRTGSAPVTSYRRSVLFLRPNLFVMYDDMQTDRAVTMDWLLHSWNRFAIDEPSGTVTAAEGAVKAHVRILADASTRIAQSNEFLISLPEKYRKQWHLTASLPASRHHNVIGVISALRGDEAPAGATAVSGAGWHGASLRLAGGAAAMAAFAINAGGQARAVAIDTPEGKATATAVACVSSQAPWLYAADATRVEVQSQILRFSRPVDVTVAGGAVTIASDAPFRIEGRGEFAAGVTNLGRD